MYMYILVPRNSFSGPTTFLIDPPPPYDYIHNAGRRTHFYFYFHFYFIFFYIKQQSPASQLASQPAMHGWQAKAYMQSWKKKTLFCCFPPSIQPPRLLTTTNFPLPHTTQPHLPHQPPLPHHFLSFASSRPWIIMDGNWKMGEDIYRYRYIIYNI